MCKGEDITQRGFGDSKNVRLHSEGRRKMDCKAISAWGIGTSTTILHFVTAPLLLALFPSQSNTVQI